MPIFIYSIETGVPETKYSQEFIRGLMGKAIRASGKTARYLRRIYSHSGIEGLRPEQIHPSREILRQFGNMSSATILFVLGEILKSPTSHPRENICAIAFGPGLTVETGLMEKRTAEVREPRFAEW